MVTIAYTLNNSLYLNITNQCPNACIFCIRNTENGVGYDLWLNEEPSATAIIKAIQEHDDYQEIVFCGYGEPLSRPEIVVTVAKWIKQELNKPVRINTNGLADLMLGYDVLPLLEGLVDTISISLNADNADDYFKLTKSKFGAKAFAAVLDFARRSKKYIPRVVLSVVNVAGVDIAACSRIAAEIGADFRVRNYQEN
ncbi:MAG TPA: TatD family nuclease-associated radical SAM protein [Bacillota bacterium]|jgi:TatD family-associated radical SAM protein|nr:TatD family nuclease-associated radical SAM protein [Bacillota bacterium]HOL10188.1 TatD family nuclease-associated radical SAM protein [Bacillota bacterium]HPO97940.1 TatD family nuclease-associated radical SAM protein [Bacillota bacterium]